MRLALIALPILVIVAVKVMVTANSHGAHLAGPVLIIALVGVSLVARLALRVAR